MRQSFLPGFDDPFVLVDVELPAQPDLRLIGRLVDGSTTLRSRWRRSGWPSRTSRPGVAVPAFSLSTADP